MGAGACAGTEEGLQQPHETNEIKAASLALLAALNSQDAARATSVLDGLAQAAGGTHNEDFCADSIAEACHACSTAVVQVDGGAQVSLKALTTLTELLQLYKQRSSLETHCQCPRQLGAVPLAKQVALALQACSDPEVLAEGLSALHALAGCISSSGAQDWSAGGVRDAVGDAGVVEAVAAALQRLAVVPSHAEDVQAASFGVTQHVAQGLEVLHCVCSGHGANLQRLAAAGGLPLVAAATALTVHPASLSLLAQLAVRQGATPAELQLSSRALLAAAQRAQHAPQLQCAALQGLYCLLVVGAPAGGMALPTEEVVGGVLPLLQGIRDASELGVLAMQVYGLASIGAVAPALPSPAPRPVLDLLQAAVAQLSALLSKSPGAVIFGGGGAPACEQQQGLVEWEALQAAVRGLLAVLASSGPEGVNTPDREGFTLLHRLASAGVPQALELLLAAPCSPPLDLLVRTREGANALQLAVRAGHAGCVAALEGATQAAAQQVMDALLAELDQEAASEGSKAGKAGGGKKKKAVTRSPSFASEQPSERAAKLGQAQGLAVAAVGLSLTSSGASCDTVVAATELLSDSGRLGEEGGEADLAQEAASAAPSEEQMRRQELEEAYERALEARRRELEQQAAQRAQQVQDKAASPAPNASPRSAQPPSSPQEPEDGPIPVSAFAVAMASTAAGGGDGDVPLFSAFAAADCAGSGQGSAPVSPSPATPTDSRQTAFSICGLDLSHTVGSSQAPKAPAHQLVQMAPALSGELLFQQHQPLAQQERDSPSPTGYSAFAAAAATGSPFASAPFATPPQSAFAAAAAMGVPQRSASLSLAQHPSGGMDQVSAFAQLAAAGLTPFGSGAVPQMVQMRQMASPPPAGAPGVLAHPGDAAMQPQGPARPFSSQLQDAMFYAGGEPAGSPPNAAAAAALARNNLAAAAVSNLAARAASLPIQLVGPAGSAADEILNLLPLVGGLAGGNAAAAAALEGLARQHSQAWAPSAGGPLSESGSGEDRGKGGDPDVSCEPTRHLWIGNLGTRTPRAVLKTIFEKFGVVDDVVTFPGRMYAFVNFRSLEETVAAYEAMQSQVVPELTGDRPLLLKFRPAKKAAAHLRALGLAPEEGASAEAAPAPAGAAGGAALPGAAGGLLGGEAERLPGAGGADVDKDGNSLEPSPRIWLGNIAPTATSKSLHAVLSRFGVLMDAAVFPARIGPLGYAFVKFEKLEDAVRAYEALNNTVVPPLSGSKQLKMRYKPPSDGPPGKDDLVDGSRVMVPSRHLWLGNVTQKPTEESVLEVFQTFGKVDSVRVFPVKAYAFVNFAEIASAIKAMSSLEGVPIPALTGVKPLVMRYQQEAVVAAAAAAAAGGKPPGVGGALSRAASDAALALGGQLVGGVGSPVLPPLLGGAEEGGLQPAEEQGIQAVANLSNRLNPNNVHFDPALAERYKALSRREKDMLWATDQLMAAHQMAAQQQAAAAAAGGSGPPAAEAMSMLNRGMNRSHSWNISMLHSHMQQHPNQPASGLSPALAAAAALAAAQQQQAAAQQQSHMAALRLLNNPGEPPVYPPGPAGMHPAGAPDMAPGLMQQQHHHHHQGQQGLPPPHMPGTGPPLGLPPTGASPAQLSAVLSSLAALQSMQAGGGPVAAATGAGLAASMQRANSMPVAGGHVLPVGRFGALETTALVSPYLNGGQHPPQQHDVLAGLMMPSHSPPSSGGPGLGAASPDLPLDISNLSSMLAKHSLSAGAGGTPPGSSPMPAHSLAAAMANLGGRQGVASPLAAASLPMSPPRLPISSAPPPTGSPSMLPAGAGGIPDQLLCPLSGQVMLDPVVAADGVTYERKAIDEWLAVRDTSPITQAPLPHKMLTPSVATKAALMDFLQRSSRMAM